MRIWGYVLIFLNLVAAGAFVYFALSVRKARTEWQFALLKQELLNQGLPMEAPDKPAGNLDADEVAFHFRYSETLAIETIRKDKLKSLVPLGGDVLGATGNDIVSNQTDEVKRVEKIIFGQLDQLSGVEKRKRLMILLLNLAKNSGREGVHALLRDLPDQRLRDRVDSAPVGLQKDELIRLRNVKDSKTRFELAFLGRSGSQQAALLALAALGDAEIGFGANVDPRDRENRIIAGRNALADWARSEVYFAIPNPAPGAESTDERYTTRKKAAAKERDDLLKALDPFLKELQKPKPDPAVIDAGKQRLTKELLEGDNKLTNPEAATSLSFIAEIAGNLLNTPEELAAAKAKLSELLNARTTTESEKKAIAAIADLMVPAKADDKDRLGKIETAATELLHSYFEETTAKASSDPKQKPLRDPGEKKRNIAHLLFHLDAQLGGSLNGRNAWFDTFVLTDTKSVDPTGKIQLPPYDASLVAKRNEWHARVVAIIGFEAYVETVEAQATELANLSKRLAARVVDEQSGFDGQYQPIVHDALYYSRRLAQNNDELTKQKKLLEVNSAQLNIRLSEQQELENKLAEVTVVAKKSLEELNGKVDELFQITKRLGEAQDALIGLEVKLRDLELPQFAPKK